MVHASVYFGFAASMIWVAEKDYNLAKHTEIDQPSNNYARSEKEGAFTEKSRNVKGIEYNSEDGTNTGRKLLEDNLPYAGNCSEIDELD